MGNGALQTIRFAAAVGGFALLMVLDWALKPKPAPMTLEIPREYYASDEAWIEAKRMIEAANRP